MRRVLAAGILLLLASPAWSGPGGRPPPPVKAAEVVRKKVRAGQTFVGSVTPLRHTKIAAGVEGFLQTLHVREGQRVEEGAVIAELELDLIHPQSNCSCSFSRLKTAKSNA